MEGAHREPGGPSHRLRASLAPLTPCEPHADHSKLACGREILGARVLRVGGREFSRGMPALRPYRPSALRGGSASFTLKLPTEGPLDPTLRGVVFDGGLPATIDLTRWVTLIEPDKIGPSVPHLVDHGLGVTGAYLFGSLVPGVTPPRPLCHLDHVRVLDDDSGKDLEVIDVLTRIVEHLDDNDGLYQFMCLSLGPDMAVDDDEVTAWTAELDRRLVPETHVGERHRACARA